MAVIAFYTCLFGGTLFFYEIRLGEWYKRKLYKYAGFLFGYTGRLVFLWFLATLCFAVPKASDTGGNNTITYIAGSWTLFVSLVNCYGIYCNADFVAFRQGNNERLRERFAKTGRLDSSNSMGSVLME